MAIANALCPHKTHCYCRMSEVARKLNLVLEVVEIRSFVFEVRFGACRSNDYVDEGKRGFSLRIYTSQDRITAKETQRSFYLEFKVGAARASISYQSNEWKTAPPQPRCVHVVASRFLFTLPDCTQSGNHRELALNHRKMQRS